VAFTKIPFPALSFAQGGHPLERKKVAAHPSVAVLEFGAGFADPNWCTRAHVFHVLEGELTLELDAAREVLRAGDACVIDAGTRHRAMNAGHEPVVLFAVSDLAWPGPVGPVGHEAAPGPVSPRS
jgi:mannose-6-phosphate isomerase-like protein (cupin superfamily)